MIRNEGNLQKKRKKKREKKPETFRTRNINIRVRLRMSCYGSFHRYLRWHTSCAKEHLCLDASANERRIDSKLNFVRSTKI